MNITTPTDNDLIRRGDALEAVTHTAVKWGFTGEPAILIDTKDAIRALAVQPALVATCPDQCDECRGKSFATIAYGYGWRCIECKKVYAARILSAVTARPVAEVQAEAVALAEYMRRQATAMVDLAGMASCTCGSKTPQHEWHLERCTYRILCETAGRIECVELPTATAALDRRDAATREAALREALNAVPAPPKFVTADSYGHGEADAIHAARKAILALIGGTA